MKRRWVLGMGKLDLGFLLVIYTDTLVAMWIYASTMCNFQGTDKDADESTLDVTWSNLISINAIFESTMLTSLARQTRTGINRRGIATVPLWINGESVHQSSGGTARIRHSQSREDTCEVVLAGEAET